MPKETDPSETSGDSLVTCPDSGFSTEEINEVIDVPEVRDRVADTVETEAE